MIGNYGVNNVLPYTEDWTLDVQWQPRNDMSIDIGYVGWSFFLRPCQRYLCADSGNNDGRNFHNFEKHICEGARLSML